MQSDHSRWSPSGNRLWTEVHNVRPPVEPDLRGALERGEYGITVNAVIPGLIDTALTRHEGRYAQAIEDAGGQPTGSLEKDEATAQASLTKKVPLGVPWIEPKDVAPVVVFLASDDARTVSGATHDVTGSDSARFGA